MHKGLILSPPAYLQLGAGDLRRFHLCTKIGRVIKWCIACGSCANKFASIEMRRSSILWLQCLQSSHPGVASFSTSAMLHCEAFLHPRTAVQLLEPVPESHLPAAGKVTTAFLPADIMVVIQSGS